MHILECCSPPSLAQDGADQVVVSASSEEDARSSISSRGRGGGNSDAARAAAPRECEIASGAGWSWTREEESISRPTFASGVAAPPRSPPRLTTTASAATNAPQAGGLSPWRRQTEPSSTVAQNEEAVPSDTVHNPALSENDLAVERASTSEVARLPWLDDQHRPVVVHTTADDDAPRATAVADELPPTLAARREVLPPLPENDDRFSEGKEHRFCVLPTLPVPVDPHVDTVSHLLSQLERWETSCSDADGAAHNDSLAETLQVLGDWCGRLPDWSDACQQLLKVQVPSRTLKVMERLVTRMQPQPPPPQHQSQLQPSLGPSNNAVERASSNLPHSHNAHDTLLQGCYVLANLCYRAGPEAQSRIGDMGGVEILIQVLQVESPCVNHDSDDDDTALLPQFACGALGNLIRMGHIDNARRLVRAGGVEQVIQVMEHHPHALELQEWGFRALHNVCHWSDFRSHVVNAGGVTAIEAARRNHARKVDGSEEEANRASHDDHFHRQTEWAMAVLVETAQSSPQ